MSVFWSLAVILVVIALLFTLPPLLRQPRRIVAEGNEVNVQVIRDQIGELLASLIPAEAEVDREVVIERILDRLAAEAEEPPVGEDPATVADPEPPSLAADTAATIAEVFARYAALEPA